MYSICLARFENGETIAGEDGLQCLPVFLIHYIEHRPWRMILKYDIILSYLSFISTPTMGHINSWRLAMGCTTF